jgi:hypothetical protein
MGFTFATPTTVGGTVLVIERIESQNYIPGVSGWVINANGDAEFFNLIARGGFISGDGTGSHWELTTDKLLAYSGLAGEVTPGGFVVRNVPDKAELQMSASDLANVGGSRIILTADGTDPSPVSIAEIIADSIRFSGAAVVNGVPPVTTTDVQTLTNKTLASTKFGTVGTVVNGMQFGSFAGTTNTSGQITVPHSLGTVPTSVMITGADRLARVQAKTATDFTLLCFGTPGATAITVATPASGSFIVIA